TLSLFWFAGYLSGTSQGNNEGYGYFSMNILSFFDPVFDSSRFLKQNAFHEHFLPYGQYEGYQYLGFGMILLLSSTVLVSLAHLHTIRGRNIRRFYPLVAAAFAFWLLALSNKVMLGNVHLFTIPLPSYLTQILSIFRSSGRFGWPMFYLVYL